MKSLLKFRKDGTLKIMQITDMHYTFDNEDDKKAVALARMLIEKENPDFIMLTGDIVYGKDNMKNMDKAFAPMVESGKPWGFVFGNHDVEENSNREEFFGRVTKLKGCISFHDPGSIDGVGNHVLEVKNADNELRWLLFCLDSGDYNSITKVGGYGYVTSNQISWYRREMQDYHAKYKDFSAMMFMHMAIPEYKDVWDYHECHGVKLEDVCSPYINSGLFTAMLEEGHMKGLFVGHDHVNDYWGNYYGIRLGYGRYGGYSSYGAKDFLRGGRVFVLNESDLSAFDTYVCLENGIRVKEPYGHSPEKRR